MAKKLGGHRLSGINPLSYLGVDPSSPSNFVVVTRAPTINDVNHNIGTVWLHDKGDSALTNDVYMLVDIDNALNSGTSPQGPAIWSLIGVGSSTLVTLTGDGGGPISPDGMGNIDMLGGDLITTTGTGNQITFDLDNGSDGEIIIASTAGSPAYASLTSTGGTVTITPGSNTINLEAGAGTITQWSVVTGSTKAMVIGEGYFSNYNGTLVFLLPAVAAVGDTMQISQMFAGQGWSLTQNAGQTCFLGDVATTTTSGTLSSTADGDWIELVCRVANTDWAVSAKSGNITYT